MVHQFFLHGVLEPGMNDTNIILVSKREGAVRLENFWPISLFNVRYKIISKILVGCIRPLLKHCISDMQGAFLPRRRPFNNLIIAKEVIHMMSDTSRRKEYCAVKLDVRKVYNRLSWHFIHSRLLHYGFSETMVQRIMTCISTVSYRVVIDGHMSDHVTPSQGLR